jgi:hypothetical protein
MSQIIAMHAIGHLKAPAIWVVPRKSAPMSVLAAAAAAMARDGDERMNSITPASSRNAS